MDNIRILTKDEFNNLPVMKKIRPSIQPTGFTQRVKEEPPEIFLTPDGRGNPTIYRAGKYVSLSDHSDVYGFHPIFCFSSLKDLKLPEGVNILEIEKNKIWYVIGRRIPHDINNNKVKVNLQKALENGELKLTRRGYYPQYIEGDRKSKQRPYNQEEDIVYYDEYKSANGNIYAVKKDERGMYVDIKECIPTKLWIQKDEKGQGLIGVYENTDWGDIPFDYCHSENNYYSEDQFKDTTLGKVLNGPLRTFIDLTTNEKVTDLNDNNKSRSSFVPKYDEKSKVQFPLDVELFMSLIKEITQEMVAVIDNQYSYQLKDGVLIESRVVKQDNGDGDCVFVNAMGNEALKNLITNSLYSPEYSYTGPFDEPKEQPYDKYIEYVMKIIKNKFYSTFDQETYNKYYSDSTLVCDENQMSNSKDDAKLQYCKRHLKKVVEEIFGPESNLKSYKDFIDKDMEKQGNR